MAHSHVLLGLGEAPARPEIRRIGVADITDALRKGFDDFLAMPTHAMFLCLIYPVIGLIAARAAFGYSFLPLLYPFAAGFALVGPLAALGLYELSRRRERGLDTSASHAFDVLNSSSIGAISLLALLFTVLFAVWVLVADAIYTAHFGYAPPESITRFVEDVLTTKQGWSMILIGNAAGFVFAAIALTIGIVSFPMLVDRDVGAAVALGTSIRAVMANPLISALWGLIVASLLVMGSLPAFLGLTVVLPVLGHSSWHLYRKMVVPHGEPPVQAPPDTEKHYAADFPANLFRLKR